MTKFVGKIKGRGFFAGCGDKPYSRKRPQDDIDRDLARAQGAGWHWYTVQKTETRYKMDILCKRNASDIPKEFILESEDELKAKIVELKNNFAEFNLDFSKIEIVELDEENKQKRVLDSKKKTAYADQILKIKDCGTKKVEFCASCGTNMYEDEPRMYSPYATLCIHCLKLLGDSINEAYESVPEKYKGDYLLARSVDI